MSLTTEPPLAVGVRVRIDAAPGDDLHGATGVLVARYDRWCWRVALDAPWRTRYTSVVTQQLGEAILLDQLLTPVHAADNDNVVDD